MVTNRHDERFILEENVLNLDFNMTDTVVVNFMLNFFAPIYPEQTGSRNFSSNHDEHRMNLSWYRMK